LPSWGTLLGIERKFGSIVAFIVYGIIGLKFQPQSQPSDQKKEAAALMYVMLILMMIAPLSGSLTFYFDYYRVPVFLLFVVIVALMYALFKVDHFFELNLNGSSLPFMLNQQTRCQDNILLTQKFRKFLKP
jgi:peptidoglycan/LPS O-acetylase OafA/YrhL